MIFCFPPLYMFLSNNTQIFNILYKVAKLTQRKSKNIIKKAPTNISLIDESRINRKYMNNLF